MASHPELHSKLLNFSTFRSFQHLVSSEDITRTFMEEFGLIPSKQSVPPMCVCGLPMKVECRPTAKLGWIWRCSTPKKKSKKFGGCRKLINPSHGTFVDGDVCRISLVDVLTIILAFVAKNKVTDTHTNLNAMRRSDDRPELSCSTCVDYYSYCREVAEVIVSHEESVFGGPGKTVQVDETFLTKRKYHRGRITEQMTFKLTSNTKNLPFLTFQTSITPKRQA